MIVAARVANVAERVHDDHRRDATEPSGDATRPRSRSRPSSPARAEDLADRRAGAGADRTFARCRASARSRSRRTPSAASDARRSGRTARGRRSPPPARSARRRRPTDEAATVLFHPAHHAGGGVEPVRRSAGEHRSRRRVRSTAVIRRRRMQLAASRRAAEDRDAGAQRLVDAANDGEPGRAGIVRRVSDGEAEAREIGRARVHPGAFARRRRVAAAAARGRALRLARRGSA